MGLDLQAAASLGPRRQEVSSIGIAKAAYRLAVYLSCLLEEDLWPLALAKLQVADQLRHEGHC